MSDLIFSQGHGYTKTVYNYTKDGWSTFDGPPFPPGVLQLELGAQVYPFTIVGGRADLTISAADVAKMSGGTAWKLVWKPSVGPQEILDQGVTKTLVPCCGD